MQEKGQKGEKMPNQENRDTLAKLETIRAELWKLADKFNRAGYKATPQEVHAVDQLAQLAAALQKLARL